MGLLAIKVNAVRAVLQGVGMAQKGGRFISLKINLSPFSVHSISAYLSQLRFYEREGGGKVVEKGTDLLSDEQDIQFRPCYGRSRFFWSLRHLTGYLSDNP